MSLAGLFGIAEGELVNVSGPTDDGDLLLTVRHNGVDRTFPWGYPETDEELAFAGLVGADNFSVSEMQEAKGTGLWG